MSSDVRDVELFATVGVGIYHKIRTLNNIYLLTLFLYKSIEDTNYFYNEHMFHNDYNISQN